jgi:hypothetical protein
MTGSSKSNDLRFDGRYVVQLQSQRPDLIAEVVPTYQTTKDAPARARRRLNAPTIANPASSMA